MRQIADWLREIGLEQYAQRFAENDIDVSVLRHLTDADLEKIGVSRSDIGVKFWQLSPSYPAHLRQNMSPLTAWSHNTPRNCRAPPSNGDVLRLGRFNGALGPRGP